MTAGLSRWSQRLGGPRVASAILLDALGSGTVMPLGVLFFTLHEHLRVTTVGLGMTIGGALSVLLAPLGGHLIDAMRPKRALTVSWLASALAAASWVLVHNLLALVIVQSVQLFVNGIGWNATTALLADLSEPEDMSMMMATELSLKNFGFGAGGMLATLALAAGGIGFDLAVYINAASFLIAVALVLPVSVPARQLTSEEPSEPTTIWTVLTDGRYVALALLNALIAFNQVALQVILPLWVVHRTHAPRELVGLLFTLNTILVVTCQLRFAAWVRELSETRRAYAGATAAMALAAGAYIASHYTGAVVATALLVLGTVALTTTEMCSSSCSFLVSLRLAREEHRGKYLSVFGIGWSIEQTVGPAAGTALIAGGVLLPWAALLAAVGAGALGSAAIVGRVRDGPGSVTEEPARAGVG